MHFDVETIGVVISSLMANVWEKAIPILAGNLNLGLSYLITTVIICTKWEIHRIMISSECKQKKNKESNEARFLSDRVLTGKSI